MCTKMIQIWKNTLTYTKIKNKSKGIDKPMKNLESVDFNVNLKRFKLNRKWFKFKYLRLKSLILIGWSLTKLNRDLLLTL